MTTATASSENKKIVLLDGGMGQELLKRSDAKPTPLWSARVMLDTPELVMQVHRDFIRAGARVLTLNTYSATPERLARDASEDLFQPLQAQAVECVKQAIDAAKPDFDVQVAGCLPPLFGSYHPEAAPEEAKSRETYARLVEMQNPHVDLFQCETMSSVSEAIYASEAAMQTGKPVWCALSVDDDKDNTLRSGESLDEALAALQDVGVQAVLLNCSRPEVISAGMPSVAAQSKACGAYANGFTNAAALQLGTTVEDLGVRSDLGPDAYADFAMSWIKEGATIVGGCCEVGPDHIATLGQRIEAAGHEIVSAL